jgi:cell division protein FtsW
MVAVALAAAIAMSPYRLARVRAFLDAGMGGAAGWQSYQSLVAIGSGGLIGRGYGAGLQKLFFLPEPHTDFIFAITGEELGLVGLLSLLGLTAVITWRGFVIAARLESPERSLLAFGITVAFAAQSLVHMAVCLDLLPPKGIPLPLVSYGKTEMVVTMVSLGLLLNLSREVTR